MSFTKGKGYRQVIRWLKSKNFKPFPFQEEAWQHYLQGYSGLVNAPTGFGKTFSLFLAPVIQHLDNPKEYKGSQLQVIWLTPLRSLAKDLGRAMAQALNEIGLNWQVAIRNGDTTPEDRNRQRKSMPEVLIITPESLHLLLALKDSYKIFENLQCIIADEWHELMGSKRGVMVELAISRIHGISAAAGSHQLRIWGISATIGNMVQALNVLVPYNVPKHIVTTTLHKKTKIQAILPDSLEVLPWAGHLGVKLADKLLPIIHASKTTLIFVNTRGQAELWYQTLLTIAPDLAGLMAIHHGSIDNTLRSWIEDSLHTGALKAVVCTSSLDLGVDFKPVDTVVQIGSAKGIARFLQRAGRSGHSPHATSIIYFLPTHALELVEAAAIKEGAETNNIEPREPFVLSFDILVQYLITLAIGDGFRPQVIFQEVIQTHAFSEMLANEWAWILQFITTGGSSLTAYQDFKKIIIEDGIYKIKNRHFAMKHRLQIGAIVGNAMLRVKMVTGSFVGMIEEGFISKLKPGDVFTLAGKHLEYVQIKEMNVLVRKSNSSKSVTPSWDGGRLPLSSNLGNILRQKYSQVLLKNSGLPELDFVYPLFIKQRDMSHVPAANELLIELINNNEGFHLFAYPFEGRLVHEVLAALVAYRLSRLMPITFSMAMNDYGFELLSDQPIPIDDAIAYEVFSPHNLTSDIVASINSTEMARRKFRDIACIAGLVFQGYPSEYVKNKHLQASAGLFFNVFSDYDPENLLLRQSYDEVFHFQLEEPRLSVALQRIQQSRIVITTLSRFTPFAFPIKVDSLRQDMSSEELAQRIERMKADAVEPPPAKQFRRPRKK